MLRKFVEGLVFGAGFTIAVFITGTVGTSVMFSLLPSRQWSTSYPESMHVAKGTNEGDERPFYELTIEEQIEQASVIAVAGFEPAEDGRMKAVLKEFLKRKEGTVFHYNIGDEYSPASYYPKEGTTHGDGIVILFDGSPAMMRTSMTYSGDRIIGLGDMPLKLFREKCDADTDASNATPGQ